MYPELELVADIFKLALWDLYHSPYAKNVYSAVLFLNDNRFYQILHIDKRYLIQKYEREHHIPKAISFDCDNLMERYSELISNK